MLIAKPCNLNSVTGTNILEGTKQLSQVVLSPRHYTHTHIHHSKYTDEYNLKVFLKRWFCALNVFIWEKK